MNILALFMFDTTYLLYVMIPGMLLALWAQMRVKSAYAHASQIPARSGLSGAEAAQRILDINGIRDVGIEPVQGMLGDHYDPKKKMLRLSPDVYNGRSLASLGIAAHEVGHAIQHDTAYAPLSLRSTLVPVAVTGTWLSEIMIIAGLLLQPLHGLALIGVLLFAVFVLFTLVTLPVEFDASRRARQILLSNGMVSSDEDQVVGKVLNAAALTYVAAAVTAVMTLLYYLSILSGRRD